MKLKTIVAINAALLLLAGLPALAADSTLYTSRSGSKMRIEGTSSVHDWQCESPFIGGSLEVGPGFPGEPGAAAKPGKIDAKGEVFITVRSLKSLEKDGKPYSDAMDERVYEAIEASKYPKISFYVTGLTLKEPAASKDKPYVFDATGNLVLHGVTNSVSMPVNVMPVADKKVKISGTTTVKMTAFKIDPPAPKLALGLIKTGDDVKVIFDWMIAPRQPAAATK
jgi:hypothetical protein